MIPETCQKQKAEGHRWQKDLIDSFTNVQELLAFLELKTSQVPLDLNPLFPLRVPRTFAQKMKKGDPLDPLLRQILPLKETSKLTIKFEADPLQEKASNPVPGLLHKYKNRVLLIASQSCAIHCQYCFRKEFPYEDNQNSRLQWQSCFDYIAQDSSIVEVILSGGDPLNLSDKSLVWFYEHLSQISHVKLVRFHSRTPVTIPSRLSNSLCDVFKSSRLQTVMVLHANHPNEICDELKMGVQRLRDHHVTVLNQSVLLKGVNDDEDTLIALSHKLFSHGIMPYYLHLLDPVTGNEMFYTPETKIQSLSQALHENLPGYLVPKIVREVAGLPGKQPFSSPL